MKLGTTPDRPKTDNLLKVEIIHSKYKMSSAGQ